MWIKSARLLLVSLFVAATPLSVVQSSAATISIDTSSLNPLAVYSLDMVLVDGGDGNTNTVSLSSFSFGLGGFVGLNTTFPPNGGYVPNVATPDPLDFSLTDSDPAFNGVTFDFTPGSVLTFDLTFTTVLPGGSFPDLFTVAILDSALAYLPTSDPSSVPDIPSLVRLSFDSGSPTLSQFELPTSSPVAEPASLLLLGTGLVAVTAWRRRK